MQNQYLSLLKTAWMHARADKGLFVVVYVMFILANAAISLSPLLYKWFIDGIQEEGTAHLYYAGYYVLGYGILKALEWAFHGPARIMEQKLAFNVSSNYLQQLFSISLHLPLKWHAGNHSGATISRIKKAYLALLSFLQNGFLYISAISKFVFSLIGILVFAPLYGGLAVVLGLITVWIIYELDKPYVKAVDEVNEKTHILSGTLADSLANVNTVVTLRLQTQMELQLASKLKDILPPFLKNIKINELKWFVADILVSSIYCIAVIGYVHQNASPTEPFKVGNLLALLAYVTQFIGVFQSLASYYSWIVQANVNIQTVRTIEAEYSFNKNNDSKPLPSNWEKISISDLNFIHTRDHLDDSKYRNLSNVSVDLNRGKKIAIIGKSGSGKSTLLSVLRGIYDPLPDSKAFIDNKQIIDIRSLAASTTLFPQEPEVFENTIEHNITLGLPFSKEAIIEACRIAHFTEVANGLPQGFETNIFEKGVNLSGGQRQRLALARGILAARDSDIVLMDEPTSSVDSQTELIIYKNLFDSYKEKVFVSSLHRLYLLHYFDYIYVLDKGTVVEEGSLETLLNNGIMFKELWKIHHKNFKQEADVEN